MPFARAAAAALSSLIAIASPAQELGPEQARGAHRLLAGEWVQAGGRDPGAFLAFDGEGRVRGSALWEDGGWRACEISGEHAPGRGDFTVVISWTAKVRRGNGRVIDRVWRESYLHHTDTAGGKAVPVLSELAVEHDGRGLIVLREYVRKDRLPPDPAAFSSELRRKLNGAPRVPTQRPAQKRAFPAR
ncbi:MAG: hypothetical protein HUK26_07885 [Duodenibacillus sp.]|nr:hypothetical protein [Duodenibacillus sp.]